MHFRGAGATEVRDKLLNLDPFLLEDEVALLMRPEEEQLEFIGALSAHPQLSTAGQEKIFERALASSPSISRERIEGLALNPKLSSRIREEILELRLIEPELLGFRALANLFKKEISFNLVRKILKSSDRALFEHYLTFSAIPPNMLRLAYAYSQEYFGERILGNKALPRDVMIDVVKSGTVAAKCALAANVAAPPDLLRELLNWKATWQSLSHNYSTTLDVRKRLLDSENINIIRRIAYNTELDEEASRKILRLGKPELNKIVSLQTVSEVILQEMVEGKYGRAALDESASNPHLTPEQISTLLETASMRGFQFASFNPSLKPQHYETLILKGSPAVRLTIENKDDFEPKGSYLVSYFRDSEKARVQLYHKKLGISEDIWNAFKSNWEGTFEELRLAGEILGPDLSH